MGEAAQRLDRFYDLVEGQVLMGIGVQRQRPHLRQQVCHALPVLHIDAQRQCVNEESDEIFQLLPRTVRYRRADHDVVLATQA